MLSLLLLLLSLLWGERLLWMGRHQTSYMTVCSPACSALTATAHSTSCAAGFLYRHQGWPRCCACLCDCTTRLTWHRGFWLCLSAEQTSVFEQYVLLQVFLDGLQATMRADADFKGGWYDPQKPPTVGPRAFARVYAGWGLSQPFYWEEVWLHQCFCIDHASSSLLQLVCHA